ncbi:glycosyl hydrolase family 3 protein [Olsenella sp. DNF00959]|nr:glycosyl hydrolase family 3 protein [Olsenella sp. DNF00959]
MTRAFPRLPTFGRPGGASLSPDAGRRCRIALRVAAGLGIGLVVAANVAAVRFGETIDSYLSSDEVDVSDVRVEAQMARDEKLSEEVEAEGLVLVQNRGDVLPLPRDVDRVNVFGWGSTQWVGGGSGSGGVAGECEGILQALTDEGIAYNEALAKMYRNFQGERPFLSNGSLNTHDYEFCRLYEPSVEDEGLYTPELLQEAREYSSTAIVVLSRVSGESIDCPREQFRVTTKGGPVKRSMARHYLEPSPEEEALIRYVAANYQNVVVLVNSTNPMELGVVESVEGVDACMLVGATGTTGARAVVRALWGDVNPSGRTTDTYAYDFSTSSSWANAGADGEGHYLDAGGCYPADGTLNGNVGTREAYDSVRFVDYAEGIYVGYRWYETADAEGFWEGERTSHGEGYDGVVQYPFGHGLSYTDFSWQVVSRDPLRGGELDPDGSVTTVVRVTNTGSRAGKDVVELYATPPYEHGGIEKPSTQLVAFAKTDELQPGQSQDVTLSFDVRSLASYDCYDANGNGFAGWELERGSYRIELKRDAHTLATCAHASVSYELPHDHPYPDDARTGARVSNRFTGSSAEAGVSIDGSSTGSPLRLLTRADFRGSFPKNRDVDRTMPDAVRILNRYDAGQARAQDSRYDGEVQMTQQPSQAKARFYALERHGRLTALGRALGEDYDDERWDSLLGQLSQGQMEQLVLHGYSHTSELGVIGKPRSKELDGSSQASSFNQLRWGVGFPNPTTLAQTWNPSLSRRFGQAVGMECAMLGIDGWYAPACNLHRTPLGGRNYEYYSEDPLVSGVMAARTIEGARQAGTYTYLKHLALNEQDSYRDSLYTWLSEQSLRELYLEPFRRAVEDGGCTGVMSSYNRIGAIWAGGSEALVDGVLRGEWGFRGSVITDYSDHHAYMNADQMLRAGGSLFMDGVFDDGGFALDTTTPNFRRRLRAASKDVLYTWLNARASNLGYNDAAAAAGEATLDRPAKTKGTSLVLVVVSLVDALVAGTVVVRAAMRIRRRRRA